MKDQLIQKLKSDEGLKTLGTEKELLHYFDEEWHELELRGLMSTQIDAWKNSKVRDNKNNLVIPYLMGVADLPKLLEHRWIEGDYPDIDCDFEPDGREKIVAYLRGRWGENTCYQVATWGMLNAKSAIQALGRIFNIPPKEINDVNSKIHYAADLQTIRDLAWLENRFPDIKAWLTTRPEIRMYLDKMLGCIKTTGINASALIISTVDLTKYLPLIKTNGGEIIVGAQDRSGKKELQGQGFVKFDILGLNNLKIIKDAEAKIKERHGTEINWAHINLNEPAVYKNMNAMKLEGIFQMDSRISRNVVSHAHPNNFMEIANTQSLIRPGNISVYAHISYEKHKLGQYDRTKYPVWTDLKQYGVSDDLIQKFGESYGIILYQEQIMQFVVELGGFTKGEANKVRKLISIQKKMPEDWKQIENWKNKFLAFAQTKGLPEKEAIFWWDTICGNLEYSFAKAHAVAYGMLSYRELYLKTFYPLEFYYALARNTPVADGADRTAYKEPDPTITKIIEEAKDFKLNILRPDINRSELLFSIDGEQTLRHGLTQIKEIGQGPALDIIARRPYASFEEFLEKHVPKKKGTVERSKVSKSSIVNLILAGAFDDLNPDRNALMKAYFEHRKEPDKYTELKKADLLLKENEVLNYVYTAQSIVPCPFGCTPIREALKVDQFGTEIVIYGYLKELLRRRTKAQQKVYTQLAITDFKNIVYCNWWRGDETLMKKVKEGDFVKILCKLGLAQRLTIKRIISVEHKDI